MKTQQIKLISTLLLCAVLFSCVRTVTRVDDKKQVDLSGRWNDTDSRLVADEMISDVLSKPWLAEFTEAKGKKPTVIVGNILNKSHEHISTETFIKDIERAFINTGRVRVVQDAAAREQIRNEREDQNKYASGETAKKWGKEKGADFILQGTLNSIVDAA